MGLFQKLFGAKKHTQDPTARSPLLENAASMTEKEPSQKIATETNAAFPDHISTADQNIVIKKVKVSPAVQQHYWHCEAALELKDGEWKITLADVFAINQWGDDMAYTCVKLPDEFPHIGADELAALLNRAPLGGPGRDDGYRDIKPEEVACLIKAAKAIKT